MVLNLHGLIDRRAARPVAEPGALSGVHFYLERMHDRRTGWAPEMGRMECSLQIRRHKLSRNASSFGDGRHFRGAVGSSPDRFQKASSTSRFIWRLVVMYRLVVATDA